MQLERWRHLARARLFRLIGRNELACREYAVAFALAPDAGLARELGCLYAAGARHDEAIRCFEEAVRLQPAHAETWFNLGFVLEQESRQHEAIAAFTSAVRLQPTIDRAWYGLGLAHAACGEHVQAVAAFAEAARLQPLNGEARYQLGMACHHADDPARTRATIDELRQFDPKRANALIRDTGSTAFDDLYTSLPF